MSKIGKRLALLAVSTVVLGVVAEVAYRTVRSDSGGPEMYFRDAARKPAHLGDEPRLLEFTVGIATTVPPPAPADWFGEPYSMPRANLLKNLTWQPGATFFICYSGPQQPYFDADGCVEFHFNRFGIRDRDDLELAKPQGIQRVVCLGDSFTLGWGVRREHSWPVLVERELHETWRSVQVINAGGAGSAYVDEYALALQHRHGRFEPDLVLVSLCLNDLIVTNGKLCHYREEALPEAERPPDQRRWWMGSLVLADLARRLSAPRALDLDTDRDWVHELMQLPPDHVWYQNKDETPDCYWVSGTPQRALSTMNAWCKSHDARLAVVVWPLLQGLGEGRHYPFAALHAMVLEYCHDQGIAALDLLPALAGEPHESLWVSPVDMHPNERAQVLVTPSLCAFVADNLGLH